MFLWPLEECPTRVHCVPVTADGKGGGQIPIPDDYGRQSPNGGRKGEKKGRLFLLLFLDFKSS